MTNRPALFTSLLCDNVLGEGVVWDEQTQTALWTDIEKRVVYRSSFPFRRFESFPLPERLGSIALIKGDEDRFVGAFERGFGLYSFATGRVDWLCRPKLPDSARFNDGRVDREGRFLAGTMIEDGDVEGAVGTLYRLNGDTAEPLLSDIRISNSLCWSPDGDTMYFADTPRRLIWAFDYADGAPRNRRVFVETADNAYPDGSTVDAEGYLWNAQWGAGQVVRYAPDGFIDFTISIPAPHVTCVAFGGPELHHLIVTTAHADLSESDLERWPNSGNVFIYECLQRGLNEERVSKI